MERGTDWEREAVRRQWATAARRRGTTTRLLGGVALALFGVLLLLAAAASVACTGDAGVPPQCTPVTTGPAELALLLAGIAAVAGGTMRCWSVRQ